MSNLSPAIVILITVGLVIMINGLLILGLRRGNSQKQIELLRRAVGAARNPWAEQNREFDELRKRVEQLEADDDG